MCIPTDHHPINSTNQQISPQALQPTYSETTATSSDFVNLCLISIKAAKSESAKRQSINDICRAISTQAGVNIEWVNLLVSRLHSTFEKEAAALNAPIETKNQALDDDGRIEWQSFEQEILQSMAEHLFAKYPTEIYSMVLEQKFSPSLQLELLFVIAKNKSKWITENIASLGVKEERDRMALLKIAVKQLVPTTANTALMTRIKLPKTYNITDEASVVEIAKNLVQNWAGYMRHIDLLKIKDQKLLTHLIIYAIQCNPYSIFLMPKNSVTDKQCLADIFLACVKKATYPAQVFSWIDFPIELQSLKKAFQMIMGPESNLFDNRSYSIPVDDVIQNMQIFAKTKLPELNLEFIKQIIEKRTLSQHEIKIMLSWSAWTLESMTRLLTPEQSDWLMQHRLLEQILEYEDPVMRYQLAEAAIQVAMSLACRNEYEQLSNSSVRHTLLVNLILSQMKIQGIDIAETSQQITKQRHFRASTNKKLLIETLMKIHDSAQLSTADKENLLHHIFNSAKQSSANLYRTQAMLGLDQAVFLNKTCLTSIIEAQSAAQKSGLDAIFHKEVNLENIDKYELLFSRNPSAFFIYAGKVHNLPEAVSYKNDLLKHLKNYIQGALDGNLEKIRYDKTNNKHLQTVFTENNQKLLEIWKKGDARALDTLLPINRQKKHFAGLKLQCEQVILNNLNYLKSIPSIDYVVRYLKASPSKEKAERIAIYRELSSAIKQQRTHLKDKSSSEKNQQLQQLQFAQQIIDLARQKIDIEEQSFLTREDMENFQVLYRSKTHGILQQIDKIREMGKFICPDNEFLTIMDGLYEEIPKFIKSTSYENWTLADTDNPQDLLLCGTEVIGSCQNVNSHIEYNKCLPAYLIDGKNRLLAIKDKTGKIRMRAIFRVLWDDRNRKPVLFMEKIYPEVAQQDLSKVLCDYAIMRAKELQLPLITNTWSEPCGGIYASSVCSLGGPAPFEYVDALKGIQNNSSFDIKSAYILYQPT